MNMALIKAFEIQKGCIPIVVSNKSIHMATFNVNQYMPNSNLQQYIILDRRNMSSVVSLYIYKMNVRCLMQMYCNSKSMNLHDNIRNFLTRHINAGNIGTFQ